MVNKDKNLVFAAFQVIVLSLKGFNNSKKLLVISFIASFGKNLF